MDGNNQSVIIDSYQNHILSFTLNYQAQVLYWVGYDNYDHHLRVNSSNVDKTNRQTILQLSPEYYYLGRRHGLTLFENVLFLSLPRNRELYKFSIGQNLTSISNGMRCKLYGRLKVVTKQQQPPGNMQSH